MNPVALALRQGRSGVRCHVSMFSGMPIWMTGIPCIRPRTTGPSPKNVLAGLELLQAVSEGPWSSTCREVHLKRCPKYVELSQVYTALPGSCVYKETSNK